MAATTHERPSGGNRPAGLKVTVDTKTTAAKVERDLATLFCDKTPSRIRITVARNLRTTFFADTWVAILIGTAARHSLQVDLVDWQNYIDGPTSYEEYVCGSLPATTGVSLGVTFESLDGKLIPLTKQRVEDAICDRSLPLLDTPPEDEPFADLLPSHAVAQGEEGTNSKDALTPTPANVRLRGLLRTARGDASTVCEFDPNHSLSDLFSDGKYPLHTPQEQSLFQSRILQFRKELEFGAKHKGVRIVSRGEFRRLTDFLMELHENSHDYGRYGKPAGSTGDRLGLPGVRFLRLRKYIGPNADLISKATELPPLQQYLERTLIGKSSVIIEASVSDFGLGIVEYFRTSSAGRFYEKASSREILSLAFRGRLTSKTGDPAAGAGIHKALTSARRMAGFASLRTADQWLQRGFHPSDSEPSMELSEMLPGQNLAPVSGTHWHFLYHQNIDYDPLLNRGVREMEELEA
jgi:hypothetical protein